MAKNRKSDDNIPVKIVTTYSGKQARKDECKYIEGQYYLIGDPKVENSGDCYYMEASDKYVRFTSELIIYDHNVKSYVYKNTKSFHKGVVNVSKSGELTLGYFSYKRLYLLPVIITPEGDKHYCVNENILNNQNIYKEDLSDGIFYHSKSKKATCFTRKSFCSYEEKKKLSYSVDAGLIKTNKISHKEGFDYKINSFVEEFGSFAGDFTYGLEFETSKGYVPPRICRKLGLIPLRDGSIDGLEFVTIPLEGKIGLQTVIQATKELNKRTETNSNCSLHLHIGNIPRTEKFFLAMYRVLFLVQDEIFSLFPIYKKDNRGLKRKHYTKPFDYKDVLINLDKNITDKNVTENFSHLFRYLSMGKDYSDYDNKLRNVNSHPSDPNGSSKWNIKSRYHWVNLIPLLFGNKQTIEFRVHTATHDYGKVMLYMAICMSIVRYTIEHQNSILEKPSTLSNIDINKILSSVGVPNYLRSLIYEYCKDRKYFINNQLKLNVVMPAENDFISNTSRIVRDYGNNYNVFNKRVLRSGLTGDFINASSLYDSVVHFTTNY